MLEKSVTYFDIVPVWNDDFGCDGHSSWDDTTLDQCIHG